MRNTTAAIIAVAGLALMGCKTVYVQEGPAAAYLPQGVGFYGMTGDLSNGEVAEKPYLLRDGRRRSVLTSVEREPVGEPIPVVPIEDLVLID